MGSFKFLFGLLPLLFMSCGDNDLDPAIKGLELNLMVLDKDGNQSFQFGPEADITLALKAINHSNDTLELSDYYNFCDLANDNEEFFLVYKETQLNDLIPIGRPFETPVSCIKINLPIFIPLPPQSELYIAMARWLDNPNNSPLKQGTYFSAFKIKWGSKTFAPEVRFTIK